MIEQSKYIETLEVAQDRFNRIQKATKYIEEKDLTNNMNFMDDGIGNLFKDILDILKGGNKDIPGFEGTLEELDNLSIRGKNE